MNELYFLSLFITLYLIKLKADGLYCMTELAHMQCPMSFSEAPSYLTNFSNLKTFCIFFNLFANLKIPMLISLLGVVILCLQLTLCSYWIKKKKKDTVGSRFYYNPWWAGVAFQSRDYSRTGLPLPPIQPWMWLPNRNKEAFNIRGAPIVDTVFGNITKKIATSSVVFPTTLLF